MKNILLLILLFVTCIMYGQDEAYIDEYEEEIISRVHILEGSFSIYSPIEAFREKLDKSTLYGFSLGYLYQLQKERPSFIGLEVFHTRLGSFSKSYDAFVGAEQLRIDGRVSSNALAFNGVYRYYIPLDLKWFEPYVDGQFGVKYMYTYLSEAGAFSDEEPYDNFDFLEGDWVLTYGGSLGFQVHVSDIYYLNFKSTYHFAVSGSYNIKKEENLSMVEFPEEAFESVQSATNMLKFDLGFTILF